MGKWENQFLLVCLGALLVVRVRSNAQFCCNQIKADGGNESIPLLFELSMEEREGTRRNSPVKDNIVKVVSR